MTIQLAAINWLAVAAAALGVFFLGALWYTVLFGKAWQRLHGYSDEKLVQMRAAKPPALFFGVMIASYALLSVVMAVLITSFGLSGAGAGLALGGLLWLGVALPIGLTLYISSDKPLAAFAIDWSYQLVFLLMAGAILGAWR